MLDLRRDALTCLVACATVLGVATATSKTHVVYWNSSNPIFGMDNTDHIVKVNEGNLPWEYDQVDIICPRQEERHIVYSVTKEEFDGCRVTNPRPRIVAVCDRRSGPEYFTITFRSFSPTPGSLEFSPGRSYYFVSTANNRDIHRRVGGWCASHHMKLIFKVAGSPLEESSNLVEDTGRKQEEESRPSTKWDKGWRSPKGPSSSTSSPGQSSLLFSSGGRRDEKKVEEAVAAGRLKHFVYYYSRPQDGDKGSALRLTSAGSRAAAARSWWPALALLALFVRR